MEHRFIVILGMFLVGYLQAAPTYKLNINLEDLHIKETSGNVICGPNVIFTSPPMECCFAGALDHFERGLKNAKENCTVTSDDIGDTLETVYLTKNRLPSCQCNTTLESRKTFQDFMEDLNTLAQRINFREATTTK